MIRLELTLEEIGLLLKHVAAAPYIEVANLIGKIQQQAQTQMQEAAAKEVADRDARERHMNPPNAADMSKHAAHNSHPPHDPN